MTNENRISLQYFSNTLIKTLDARRNGQGPLTGTDRIYLRRQTESVAWKIRGQGVTVGQELPRGKDMSETYILQVIQGFSQRLQPETPLSPQAKRRADTYQRLGLTEETLEDVEKALLQRVRNRNTSQLDFFQQLTTLPTPKA